MGGAGGAGGAGVGAGEEEVVSAGPGTVGRGLRGVRVGSAAGSRVVVEKVVGGRAAVSLGQRAARSKSIANISSSFVARGRGNALQSRVLCYVRVFMEAGCEEKSAPSWVT